MYFEKFYESVAVQDPDNPGNDLEQIEDDVLDSHDEEVDDAVYGLPGEEEDPIEEAYAAIYEAEYNFNMIYKAIGMYELNEASKGNIGDKLKNIKGKIKGIASKAHEVLKKLWENIKEAFYKFVSRINPITNIANNLYKTHTKKDKNFFKNGIKINVKEGGNAEILSLDRGISKGFDDAFVKMPSNPSDADFGDSEDMSDTGENTATVIRNPSIKKGSDISKFTTTPTNISASDLEKYVAADFVKLIREAFTKVEKEYKAASEKLNKYESNGEDDYDEKYLNWLCKASQYVVSFNSMRFIALTKCAFKTKSIIVAGMNAYIKNNNKGSAENENSNTKEEPAKNESFNFKFI